MESGPDERETSARHLRAVDERIGSGRELTGADVLEGLVAFVDEHLPYVPHRDPAREHLMRFRDAAAQLPRALRAAHPPPGR